MSRESMSITPGDLEQAESIFDALGLSHTLIRFGISPTADRWCLFRADTDEMLKCRIYPSFEWTDPE